MSYVTAGVTSSWRWQSCQIPHDDAPFCVTVLFRSRHGMRSALQNGRLSVRPSVPSIDSSSDGGGFAAEVGRGQQISIDSFCCLATCGQPKFWSDCEEVQHQHTRFFIVVPLFFWMLVLCDAESDSYDCLVFYNVLYKQTAGPNISPACPAADGTSL